MAEEHLRDGQQPEGHHGHHLPHSHHHAEQDPRLYGPGFQTPEAGTKYVLVTPEMMSAMQQGLAPQATLVHDEPPAGRVSLEVAAPTIHKPSHSHHEQHTDMPVQGPTRDSLMLQEEEEPAHLANPITRVRHMFKEYLGEFIGTMILIIFGNGVNCQVVLTNFKQGEYLSISFGWGIGVMFGVYISGGISGGHINPAVTIALAVFRGFPWRKVPGYILAQFLGAMLGACLIMGNYHNLLDQFEGGYNRRTFGLPTSTGALFFTQAQPYMSNIEVFATAVLLACIFCLSDKDNNPIPAGTNGLILCFLIIGIGATLGTETAYCLNPARDFGPRVAAAMFGYPHQIWTYRSQYWLWTPIVATTFGGLVGGFFYDLFLYQGKESPLNKPWPFLKKKKQHAVAQHTGNGKV